MPDILGVTVARTVLIVLGLVAFVVPGIVCWAQTFAAMLVVVVDGNAPMEAIDRSWRLSRGHVWRIAIILGLAETIFWIVWGGIFQLDRTAAAHHILARPIRQAILHVLSALSAPIVPAVYVALYYDLRIRKEGFDLELQMTAPRPAM